MCINRHRHYSNVEVLSLARSEVSRSLILSGSTSTSSTVIWISPVEACYTPISPSLRCALLPEETDGGGTPRWFWFEVPSTFGFLVRGYFLKIADWKQAVVKKQGRRTLTVPAASGLNLLRFRSLFLSLVMQINAPGTKLDHREVQRHSKTKKRWWVENSKM